ncbi:MAG: trypsin-like peptidase domain-containing protein [bacterium]|nr:trypsin-like peptidase domain-containing protein [bacterium]
MQRFIPYLGIIPAVVLFALLIVVADAVSIPQSPTPVTPAATSTPSAEPAIVLPPISLPGLESETNTPVASSTPTPKKIEEPLPEPAPAAVVVPIPALTPIVSSPSGNVELDVAASSLRSALANIICYVPIGGGLHSISGSGVFIDSKGIILTNAHIAQYFLLMDRGADCTIRTGSPAADKYKAALIYISPAWLRANADVLTQTLPHGTGEDDYALVAVTKGVTAAPLPGALPSLPLGTMPPIVGTPIVIASYGAQFLESSQVRNSLFPTIVFGSVKDIFTFGTNTIDVLALGGSAAAQEGSSGGGVADASGQLVGTITTSTVTGTTDTRSLDAITASYIRADYAGETGEALDLLLSRDTATSVSEFALRIPALEAIITAGLP